MYVVDKTNVKYIDRVALKLSYVTTALIISFFIFLNVVWEMSIKKKKDDIYGPTKNSLNTLKGSIRQKAK